MKEFGLSIQRYDGKKGNTEVLINGVQLLGLDHLVGTGEGLEADRAKQQALMDANIALEPRFLAGVLLSWLIIVPLTMGLSEWFARVIDDGSVRLARRMEAKCIDAGYRAVEQDQGNVGSTSSDEEEKDWKRLYKFEY